MKTPAFSWNNFSLIFFMGIILLSLIVTSCYESQEYEAKMYLDSEVELTVNNADWKGSNGAGCILNFQLNEFSLSAIADTTDYIREGFICNVRGREGVLFNDFTNADYTSAIKELPYQTNDTITVIFYYQILEEGSSKPKQWDGSGSDYNIFIIDDVFEFENEIYLSGSLKARTFKSYDINLFPSYQTFEGTFKNVRVTKIYNKE